MLSNIIFEPCNQSGAVICWLEVFSTLSVCYFGCPSVLQHVCSRSHRHGYVCKFLASMYFYAKQLENFSCINSCSGRIFDFLVLLLIIIYLVETIVTFIHVNTFLPYSTVHIRSWAKTLVGGIATLWCQTAIKIVIRSPRSADDRRILVALRRAKKGGIVGIFDTLRYGKAALVLASC